MQMSNGHWSFLRLIVYYCVCFGVVRLILVWNNNLALHHPIVYPTAFLYGTLSFENENSFHFTVISNFYLKSLVQVNFRPTKLNVKLNPKEFGMHWDSLVVAYASVSPTS